MTKFLTSQKKYTLFFTFDLGAMDLGLERDTWFHDHGYHFCKVISKSIMELQSHGLDTKSAFSTSDL